MDENANSADDSLREVYLGRQPILDKDQGLAGYELLFRTTAGAGTTLGDPRAATADVVCKAFAELGLSNVLGHTSAFINVDASFLVEDVIELLPKDMVVFELDAGELADTAVAERCRQLKSAGYRFSISGLTTIGDHLRPLLDLATYLKVDVDELGGEQLQQVATDLRTTRRILIASHVETQTQMELCALLGFTLFQGYYFAKPTVIEGRTLDPSTQGLFRLIQLIADDVEVDRIEAAFRGEPALVVNLLRLTNSVGVGARSRISSVRHAITIIGRRQLQRWLQLLLFSRNGKSELKHNPLMQYAALRGRFMELMVERLHKERRDLRDPAFITGLMSVMPAALGMSMTDILAEIAVDPDVRLALSRREGNLGQLLAILDLYDDEDVTGLQAAVTRYGRGADMGLLTQILTEALGWVQQLDTPNE